MDSTAETLPLGTKLMPFLAIFEHDLRGLWAGRLVRLWLAASALLTLLLAAANWAKFQDAPLIASLLFPYLVFPWFFVVVVLGVSPVSGARAEVLADGILSRPVSRGEYLLAAWLARVLLVWSVYLVVAVPALALVTLAKRPVPDDSVTFFGIVSALGVVGLVLTFLVSLGFLAGTLLRKPLLAAVVLVFVWYPIGGVLNVFSLEEFSPISLSRAMCTQLREPWRAAEANAKNKASAQDMEALAQQVDHFLSVLSNGQSRPAATRPDFFEGGRFGDFSLPRVLLGYGGPTLIAVALALLFFYRRDL
jgi:ABC-type transport system involved in multi-copper enzyme maturation permease subunit